MTSMRNTLDSMEQIISIVAALVILIIILSAFYSIPGSVGDTFRSVINSVFVGVGLVALIILILLVLRTIYNRN